MNNTYYIFWVVWAILAYFVYTDAKKRGEKNAVVWGVVVFLLGLIGILLYWLIVMRKTSTNASSSNAPSSGLPPADKPADKTDDTPKS